VLPKSSFVLEKRIKGNVKERRRKNIKILVTTSHIKVGHLSSTVE
jgi:hypothetical protein